jgi:hypothetical protein
MSAIDLFTTDPSYQLHVEHTLDSLAHLCASIAESKGFTHDEKVVLARMTESHQRDWPGTDVTDSTLAWLDSTILQAELARVHSELSEALEGARKPHADKHCPSLDNLSVELADAVIRIFDIAGRRQLPLGRALVEKCLANIARPYKHGKNS